MTSTVDRRFLGIAIALRMAFSETSPQALPRNSSPRIALQE
jgi:hypothetical protein